MTTSLLTPESDSSRSPKLSENRRHQVIRSILFLIALILITLGSVPPRPSPERLLNEKVGEPATRTVLAPFPLKIIDQQETDRLRQEAREKVPPTFTRQVEMIEQAQTNWRSLVQAALDENRTLSAGAKLTEASESARKTLRSLTRADADLLRRKLNDPLWREAVLTKALQVLEENEILTDVSLVEKETSDTKNSILWRLAEPDGSLKDRISWVSIRSVTQQRELFSRSLLDSDFAGEEKARNLATVLSQYLIDATLSYDRTATEREISLALANIGSVSLEFKQNQILVMRGELVTPTQKLALLEMGKRMESRLGEFLGRIILVFGILLVLFGYLKRIHKEIYSNLPRLTAYLLEITLIAWSSFIVAWGVEFDAVQTSEESISQVGLLVPIAAIGILVTLLENSRLALFSVILCTFLVGIQFNWGFDILLVLVISGIISVFHVTGVHRRSQVYLACPWIFGSGLLLILGIHLVMYPSIEAFSHYASRILWGSLWLALNSFASVGIALLVLPILEDILGITTVFKLREISTYHPLLRQLEEKAPGTYYHSLNVSALAESAAAAIGANALLVKVASYYHDIGKMEKPTYFTENQFSDEDNRKHSKISPHMSCLIIRNHIKLGLELAREHRLPEAIIPFISEHQGTTLLSYFYDRAREEDPHGVVSPNDFRYPGPKPQTIESAIVMMADSIEAASRSMKLVSEQEIRVFVKRMINDKMLDGQFDECNLNFRQIKILTESFTRTLRTMMHRRIAYPSTPEVNLSPNTIREDKVKPLFNRS
jgi:putative nucleotidyltransferase with HDIG domain